MATLPITYPVAQNIGGSDVNFVEVTAGQTFQAHQFGILTSGKFSASATSATTSDVVYGLTLAPAVDPVTATLNTRIPVIRVRPGMRFRMNLVGTLAQTDLGLSYGLQVSSNVCSVLKSDATNIVFRVVELPAATGLDGNIGDVNARVLVEVITTHIAQ